MKVDITKQYTTRDGRPVEIVAVREELDLPVIGIVGASVMQWGISGRRCIAAEDANDLIPARPPKQERTMWVNVYSDEGIYVHFSRLEADNTAQRSRIACIPVTFSYYAGEGLDG